MVYSTNFPFLCLFRFILLWLIAWINPVHAIEVNILPNQQYSSHFANNAHPGSFSPLASGSLVLQFTSGEGNVSLQLTGFGVDYVGEVFLRLDGGHLINLQKTGNFTHGAVETFNLGSVSAGSHVIKIENVNPSYTWGVSNILVSASAPTVARRLNVLDFGASGESENDDTEAFNEVIEYVNLHGDNSRGENLNGFEIHLPAGVYNLPIGLNEIIVDNVHFSGGVSGGTFIHASNGTLFHFNGSAEPLYWLVGGGVRDITIKYDSPPGSDSVIFKSSQSARQTYENIRIKNAGTIAKLGSGVYPSAQQMFRNITGWVANVPKPAFTCDNGAGLFISDSNIFVQHVPTPSAGSSSSVVVGRDFLACSGAGWDTGVLSNVITNRFYRGINIESINGRAYSNFYLSNFVSDYNAQNAVRIITNGGVANTWNFTNSWLSSTDGHAVHIEAEHLSQINNIKIANSEVRYSGGDGIRLKKVNDAHLTAIYTSGQGRLLGNSSGINLMSTSNVSVIGGQVGRLLNLSGELLQADWGISEDSNSVGTRLIAPNSEGKIEAFSLEGTGRVEVGVSPKE